MLSGFGWFENELTTACVVLVHVMNAFSSVQASSNQYCDSHAFLCGLYLVVNYASNTEKAASLPESSKSQIKVISGAYKDFHAYIIKYARVGYLDRGRLGTILPTVRWSLEELDQNVQHMKTNMLDSVAMMETLIIMDLSNHMNDIHIRSDNQEQTPEETKKILYDIKDQLRTLSLVTAAYQAMVDRNVPYSPGHIAASTTAASETTGRAALQVRLTSLYKSQIELERTLADLTRYTQRRESLSVVNSNVSHSDQQIMSKSSIQDTKTGTSTAISAPQESNPWLSMAAPAATNLAPFSQLLCGVAAITGNRGVATACTTVGGTVNILGAVNPVSNTLNSWFNKSEK